MSDNIKVVVKVRPLISREIDEKLSLQWRVKNNTLYQLDQSGKENGPSYTFDKVYDQETKTSDVFNDIAKPIVEAAIAGINGTIFAYGQTSSGKTYTMTGTDEHPGIIPQAILKLFDIIKSSKERDFLLRVSYIEIYNETIKDLLNVKKDKIKIHEGLQGIKVDATEKVTSSPEEVLEIMKEGEANRQIGATNMNEQSSRSHSIFQITIESREHTEGNVEDGCVNVSTLNLVDLAGSERSGQTGATGIRFKEGTHINKSLSALALVIKQLSEDRKKYANYRDSKLTRILQNSLGGNAKTSIICAVTPAAIEETVSTLQFANRAKAIENKPEVNAVATNATMIQQLTKKLSKLQSQLAVKENLEQHNLTLQKKIESLQRQIINGFGSMAPAPRNDRRQTWCAPRRMTIDSLHTIQEEKESSVTRFCTPALKYNQAMHNEFRPIEVNKTTMSREPVETPSGHITPPLIYTKKSVNVADEIIDLDSDDDSTPSDTVPCSPYHKCYESSKTPPCILREKAKHAEKNYKEIIDLTDREKIYPPPAEELLKILDENTNVITKLEDQVEDLNKRCADRDADIISLKEKITKSEEELKLVNAQKVDLDTAYQETIMKLTDMEVSLDTLKKKYLTREQELLSLLKEKNKEYSKIDDQSVDKPSEKPIDFMHLSKDISLVHSDTDNSVDNANDDGISFQKLVTDFQEQISNKNNVIQELETDLHDEKQKIYNLEVSNTDIHDLVNSLNEKVNGMELENSMLKCNIDQLHKIIETQKQSLENSSRDIESYNDLIQELQLKLNTKNDIVNFDDIDFEDMISKEKELIANNENLRNIIHSLKNAINDRNKKISIMKTECGNSNLSEIEDINNKTGKLAHEIELNEQLKDKNNEINRLTEESKTLLATNNEIVIKLVKLQKENELLTQQNHENLTKINHFNSNEEEKLVKMNFEKDEIFKQLHEKITRLTEESETLLATKNEIGRKLEILQKEYEFLIQQNQENLIQINHVNSSKEELVKINSEKDEISKQLNNEKTRLKEEGETLLATNNEIVRKLEKLQKENEILIQQNQENLTKINHLNSNKEELLKMNLEKDGISKQLNDLNQKIIDLQEDIEHKDGLILSLENDNQQQNDYFVGICIALTGKIESLLSKWGKDSVNEIIPNNIQCIFVYLNNCLDDFEKIILENVALKKLSLKTNTEHEMILEKLHSDISTYKADIRSKSDVIENLTQQNKTMALNIDNIRSELENRNKISEELDKKLHSCASVYEKISQTVIEKENLITILNEKQSELMFEIEELKTYIKAKEETFDDFKTELEFQNANYLSKLNSGNISQIYPNKDRMISDLTNVLHNADFSIPEKYSEVLKHTQIVIESMNQKERLLKNIFMKVADLAQVFDSVYDKAFFETENEAYDQIPDILDEIKEQKYIAKINEGKSDDDFLEAENRIRGLIMSNQKLKNDVAAHKQENKKFSESLDSIEEENKQLIDSLNQCNDLINSLQEEIIAKSNNTDLNTNEINYLIDVEKTMMDRKEIKNIEILNKCKESELLFTKSSNKSLMEDSEIWSTRIQIPPTLSSICFSAVMEALNGSLSSNSSPPTTTNSLSALSDETKVVLEAELKQIRQENQILKENLDFLKLANKKLIDEQSAIREEVLLIAKPAMDLQKKILKHRTNLNTLTATTYAENKALHSQVKVLHHHHSRCLNVCKKDIPQLKNQLMELYNILKTESQLKRYSLPDILDSRNNTVYTFKNDSTLDADLLMLDTNVTLATLADNTLVDHDQTCDMTQVNLDTEPQNIFVETSKQSQILTSTSGCGLLHDKSGLFIEQNKHYVHAHSSPIKDLNEFHNKSVQVTEDESDCVNCQDKNEILIKTEKLASKLSLLTKQKADIEVKYNNLKLEVPSTEALIRKLNTLETEFNLKRTECKQLQEENDILSTQVMENISEADNLKKELDDLKSHTKLLLEKNSDTQHLNRSLVENTSEKCLQCIAKDKLISKQFFESESLINRSQHDIDSSLRHSKICTLRNELNASKEDCKKITEEFGTIKTQLERSNLSMNQSMNESKLSMIDGISESTMIDIKDFDENNTQTSSKLISNIPQRLEQRTQDIYSIDKLDCFHYFLDKTGAEKENLNHDFKIIDIMKMLYSSLIIKHGNEVENLINKLKDFEESNNLLQSEVENISTNYERIRKEIEDKMCIVRKNVNAIKDNLNKIPDNEKYSKITNIFKENILEVFDTEFSLTSKPVFELLIDEIALKHQSELNQTMAQYHKLQQQMEGLMSELASVNENLIQMRNQLSEKDKECNLLKVQKEKIHEISNAVTLDIVKKEQELRDSITHGYQIILEKNLMDKSDVDFSVNLNANVKMLFEKLVSKCQDHIQRTNEKDNLILEIKHIKTVLQEKEKQLSTILVQNEKLKEINSTVTIDLVQKEEQWQKQKHLHEDHATKFEEVLAEYNNNINVIKNMNQEIHILKEALSKKESLETALNSDKINELLAKIIRLETEITQLKIVNDSIIKEKDMVSEELAKSGEIIQNKNDMINRMEAEVRALQENITQTNSLDYNLLKEEVTNLRVKITETEDKYEKKSRDCSRLEMNIKTHEKSVQIQSGIVKRLQKQKEEDNKNIAELSEKCKDLEAMKLELATSKEEVESLIIAKNVLQVRIAELEAELANLQQHGHCLEAINANSRRRRQSLHDSKRQFSEDIADSEDHNKMEVVFESRSKPDDLFIDNDENSSDRSTPSRNNSGKRRDSLHGRDQSDKEDESRSSSVAASRLRRQSIHDLHRSILTHTPSPRESLSSRLQEELSQCGDGPVNYSDYANLKATLTACQLELEELKERYKEVDEECEICAQYLRERDEQCLRLKKEKNALEDTVADLRRTLEKNNCNTTKNERSYATAAVNTDEDWANLHSVVVDRMSFDAEVEKNKKLTRAIEEFHLKNRDLKSTIAKMQKALEKYSGKDSSAMSKELETTKKDLKACQQDLEEMRKKYKELDEECETCAEYLRERDEQCQKLKEVNATLKAKLEELKEKVAGSCASRKKRQSIHDQLREPSSDFVDAATETSDDLLSYQVERDNTSRCTKEVTIREVKRLTATVEQLTLHKMTLEQQLAQLTAAQMPLYVATGSAIVQNQQMTDIMKENQKLKKINAKLVHICKKRSKSQSDANRENENIAEHG